MLVLLLRTTKVATARIIIIRRTITIIPITMDKFHCYRCDVLLVVGKSVYMARSHCFCSDRCRFKYLQRYYDVRYYEKKIK